MATEKALECFIENGIEKTKVSDIARRSGLTERSIFRYFATKTDIVIAAAFLYWEKAKKHTSDTLAAADYPGMKRPWARSTPSSTICSCASCTSTAW